MVGFGAPLPLPAGQARGGAGPSLISHRRRRGGVLFQHAFAPPDCRRRSSPPYPLVRGLGCHENNRAIM